MDRLGGDRLSHLARPLPAGFERREVAVAPGCERAYEEAEWRDALVLVERGEIELESLSGVCRSFRRGDVLWLVGLGLRALHNRGLEPALLFAVSRRLDRQYASISAPSINVDLCAAVRRWGSDEFSDA
jgi:hypothetical protein